MSLLNDALVLISTKKLRARVRGTRARAHKPGPRSSIQKSKHKPRESPVTPRALNWTCQRTRRGAARARGAGRRPQEQVLPLRIASAHLRSRTPPLLPPQPPTPPSSPQDKMKWTPEEEHALMNIFSGGDWSERHSFDSELLPRPPRAPPRPQPPRQPPPSRPLTRSLPPSLPPPAPPQSCPPCWPPRATRSARPRRCAPTSSR